MNENEIRHAVRSNYKSREFKKMGAGQQAEDYIVSAIIKAEKP